MRLNHLAYLGRELQSELGSALRFALRFALFTRVHTMPRALIARWQGRELRRTVAAAFACSPVYRHLWLSHGVRPGDIRSAADIWKLPITSKALFKRCSPGELVSGFSDRGEEYVWRETSGSTGEPFRFPALPRERRQTRERAFDEYRFLLWRGNPLHWVVEHAKIARIDQEKLSGELSITREELRNGPEAACEALRHYDADVLWGTPTSLVELAGYAAQVPEERRPRHRFLVATGETLTPAARAFITTSLGGEVYDSFGLKEIGIIGVECRMHEGFHVYEESVLVEIVNEEGKPVPAGTSGRVLVTGFRGNAAMPFIRYDTGDLGTVLAASCPCGIPARRLSIRGRSGGVIAFGAQRLHHIEFEFAMDSFHASVLRYQFAKIGSEEAELRIVPTASFSPAVAEELRARFREQFGITPRIAVLRAIPATPRGKTPTIVDETER